MIDLAHRSLIASAPLRVGEPGSGVGHRPVRTADGHVAGAAAAHLPGDPSAARAFASAGHLMPTAIRSILPSGARSALVPSLGSARAIRPAANAAAAGGVAARRDIGTTGPFTLRRSPIREAEPPAQTPKQRSNPPSPTSPAHAGPSVGRPPNYAGTDGRRPVDGTRTAGPAGRPTTAAIAGLLLRQVIPAASVVDAAIAGVIRRMPPAPPTGTPRLGSHRQIGDRRGPDVPRSADPNWSFTGARGERALTGATIGARSRNSRSLTLPVPVVADPTDDAVNPTVGATEVGGRRRSLVDLIPPSLFDRARAGLADPNGDNVIPGIQPAATPREVAMSSPTDDVVPRQQVAEALTPREWDELVDIIVDRLEDRVLDELARRGRRFTPGVF